MAFVCSACGNVQSFPLPDGKYTLPTKVMEQIKAFKSHFYSWSNKAVNADIIKFKEKYDKQNYQSEIPVQLCRLVLVWAKL